MLDDKGAGLRIRNRTSLVYAALLLAVALYMVFGLVEVYRVEGLFSYDPYYHMHLSERLDREGDIVTEIEYYEGSVPPQYISSMRLLTVLLHRYTGLSFLAIYKTLGLFLRLLTALALFVVGSRLLGSKEYGLATVLVFLSSSYIFLRSLITFPENMAVLFHVLIFGCIVDGLRGKGNPLALVLVTSGAVYVHYRSLVVPALMLAIYLLLRKNLRHAVFTVGGVAILSLPILVQAINQYLEYLHTNVGPGASWAPHAMGAAYAVPDLSYYEVQLGLPMVVFTLLGLPFLLRGMDKVKFILLAWLLLTFALTRGKALGFYIPTNRMLVYMAVPAALVSGLFLKEISQAVSGAPVLRLSLGTVAAVFLSISLVGNLINVRGWVGVSAESRQAASWLDENATEDSVVLPYQLDLVTMGMQKLSLMASVKCGWREVFDAPQGVRAKLGELFPGKDIYIITKIEGLKVHDALVVFEGEELRIYYYPGCGETNEASHAGYGVTGCLPAG